MQNWKTEGKNCKKHIVVTTSEIFFVREKKIAVLMENTVKTTIRRCTEGSKPRSNQNKRVLVSFKRKFLMREVM